MTYESSEFPSDHLIDRMAEMRDETESLNNSIDGASVLSRALGAVGIGKLPRLQEIRDANRLELAQYDVQLGRRAWRDAVYPDLSDGVDYFDD